MTRPTPDLKIRPGFHYGKFSLLPSAFEQHRTTAQEISNLADVSLRTAANAPSAFINELADDFTKRPAQVVVHVAEGAVVGAVGTALLKVPKVAPAVAALGAIYAGYQVVTAGGDFIDRASRADTEAQRQSVAQESAQRLGSTMAALTESAPGMIVGGIGVSRAFGAPPLYSRIGNAVENSLVNPARESLAFRGPGSIKFSSSLASGQGEFDALAAARIFAERHPWAGVETGSSLDLSKMRISKIVGGKAESIDRLPGAMREDVVPFHIHGPKASAGALPSDVDLAATQNLGILQQGSTTTFYVGEGRSFAALAKVGSTENFAPTMRAVSINQETGLAQRFTGEWVPSKGWQLNQPEQLDFIKSLEAVKQMKARSPWLTLSGIAAKTGG